MWKQISLNLTVQISWSSPAYHLEVINCYLILHITFTHYNIKSLCDIIATFQHVYNSYTYSCVNMCKCTNQYWSCDHPNQMLPWSLIALVSPEITTLLPTHGWNSLCFWCIIVLPIITVVISILHFSINALCICILNLYDHMPCLSIFLTFQNTQQWLSWLWVICITVYASKSIWSHVIVMSVNLLFVLNLYDYVP